MVRHWPLERNAPPIPAALDLVIEPAVGLEEPHLLTADITRITVRGLGVRIDRGGEGGGVSLVEGRPEQALLEADRLIRAGLLSDEEEARLRFFAAVAMADLGRGVEARVTSRRLLASHANDELRKRLVSAVRIGSLPARGAVSAPERDLLEVQLRGIRGEVYRRMGNLPAARQDLERVAAFARLHPGEGDEADAPGSAAWYREQAGRAERVLAPVEADDGDAGTCLAHARRAVALSAAPEVTADVLLLHPRIAAWSVNPTSASACFQGEGGLWRAPTEVVPFSAVVSNASMRTSAARSRTVTADFTPSWDSRARARWTWAGRRAIVEACSKVLAPWRPASKLVRSDMGTLRPGPARELLAGPHPIAAARYGRPPPA
ncbi:MAG: hypothetical protein JXB39_14675 [Deltaproteobacteria bacterium]|nr:hypothetical protein [Deltaproteobacteria bacterium]